MSDMDMEKLHTHNAKILELLPKIKADVLNGRQTAVPGHPDIPKLPPEWRTKAVELLNGVKNGLSEDRNRASWERDAHETLELLGMGVNPALIDDIGRGNAHDGGPLARTIKAIKSAQTRPLTIDTAYEKAADFAKHNGVKETHIHEVINGRPCTFFGLLQPVFKEGDREAALHMLGYMQAEKDSTFTSEMAFRLVEGKGNVAEILDKYRAREKEQAAMKKEHGVRVAETQETGDKSFIIVDDTRTGKTVTFVATKVKLGDAEDGRYAVTGWSDGKPDERASIPKDKVHELGNPLTIDINKDGAALRLLLDEAAKGQGKGGRKVGSKPEFDNLLEKGPSGQAQYVMGAPGIPAGNPAVTGKKPALGA